MSTSPEYSKRYYQKNRERILQKCKEYQTAHKEHIAETKRCYQQVNADKIKAHNRSDKRRFQNARCTAKSRGHDWQLSFDQFCALIKEPCHYCQGNLGNSLTGNGLDRINNDQGYLINNVLPACTLCNRIRSDDLTVEETQAAIQAILQLRQSNLHNY